MDSRKMLETQKSSETYTRQDGICAKELSDRCYFSPKFIGKLKEL